MEIYFTVLTVVILAMIVGIGAYVPRSIIPAWQKYQSPEWQRSHLPRNITYLQSDAFQSHPPELK